MGVDIHMHIVSSNGMLIQEDIFTVRASTWFDQLTSRSHDPMYHSFFVAHYGIPEKVPEFIEKDYQEHDYFDFRYILVSDFCAWFEKVRPDIDAGWVPKRDAWLYKTKQIIPEDLSYILPPNARDNEYEFIEVEDPYDCSKWLYDFIKDIKHIVQDSDYIVYYFDC